MLDAGSSGTRVHVYNWLCREIQTLAYVDIIETVKLTQFHNILES